MRVTALSAVAKIRGALYLIASTSSESSPPKKTDEFVTVTET